MGVDRRDPGVLTTERLHGGGLHSRVDRRAHRLGLDRLDAGEHLIAGPQLAADLPREPILEYVLETVGADLGGARVAERRVVGALRLRDRLERADDLDRNLGDRRDARGALGQRRPVGCQQRAARRQRRVPVQALGPSQAGEQHLGRQLHGGARACAGDRHPERLVQGAPDPRRDRHRHRYGPVARVGDLAGPHRGRGRGVRVGGQLGREPPLGHARLRRRVKHRVHRRESIVRPGGHVAGDEVLRVVVGTTADDHPRGERGGGEHHHRSSAGERAPARRTAPGSARSPASPTATRSPRRIDRPLCHLAVNDTCVRRDWSRLGNRRIHRAPGRLRISPGVHRRRDGAGGVRARRVPRHAAGAVGARSGLALALRAAAGTARGAARRRRVRKRARAAGLACAVHAADLRVAAAPTG